jgi:hypothetical protein
MSEEAPVPDKTVARKLLIIEGYRVLLVMPRPGTLHFWASCPRGRSLQPGRSRGPI